MKVKSAILSVWVFIPFLFISPLSFIPLSHILGLDIKFIFVAGACLSSFFIFWLSGNSKRPDQGGEEHVLTLTRTSMFLHWKQEHMFLSKSLWPLIVNVTGTNDLANSEHRMFRGPQLTSSLHSLKGQMPLATRRILYVFFYRSTKIENYEIYYFWWSFFHRELLPRL